MASAPSPLFAICTDQLRNEQRPRLRSHVRGDMAAWGLRYGCFMFPHSQRLITMAHTDRETAESSEPIRHNASSTVNCQLSTSPT